MVDYPRLRYLLGEEKFKFGWLIKIIFKLGDDEIERIIKLVMQAEGMTDHTGTNQKGREGREEDV